MLTKTKDKQTSYEFAMLEEVVKEDHLPRKIDKHIDFRFIYKSLKIVYTDSTHIKTNASLSKFVNEDFTIEEEGDSELLERINKKPEMRGIVYGL